MVPRLQEMSPYRPFPRTAEQNPSPPPPGLMEFAHGTEGSSGCIISCAEKESRGTKTEFPRKTQKSFATVDTASGGFRGYFFVDRPAIRLAGLDQRTELEVQDQC